jgi:hypothetical protein
MSELNLRSAALAVLATLGFFSDVQAEDTCDRLGHYAGAFVGGAAGAGSAFVVGRTGWVAAGLVGMGSAMGYDLGSKGSEAVCRKLGDAIAAVGDAVTGRECYTQRCLAEKLSLSLARDFALCVGCATSTVMNVFYMDDHARQAYLRRMSGSWSKRLTVLPRDALMADMPRFDAAGAFYAGLQIGTLRYQVVATLDR